jgi:hypothetical protein
VNYQFDTATMTTLQTIVFEPTGAGGGSLWDGDNLLATLTVFSRTERRGRLSTRNTNHAWNLVCLTWKSRAGITTTHYRLMDRQGQTGEAEWKTGESLAALRYQGRTYVVTRASLQNAQDRQPVITLARTPDWSAPKIELHVASAADLPLAAFFLFVAYDLKG